MAVGIPFDALAEVALARDLLRRWWGLELGLTEPDGGGYTRTSHATCDTVKGVAGAACASALTEIAASFSKSKRKDPIVQRCHAGLTIVAAPVYGAKGLMGVVYATGARGEGAEQALAAPHRRGDDREPGVAALHHGLFALRLAQHRGDVG